MKTLKDHLFNLALLPFYGSVLLYFLLYQRVQVYPSDFVGAALLKVLPVWSLLCFVLSTETGNIGNLMNNDYKRFISLGLLVSSVGDVLLVVRITFIPGLLVFAMAHVSYNFAFGPPKGSSTLSKALHILCGVAIFFTLQKSIDSKIMSLLVLFYGILLYVMSFRATNYFVKSMSIPTFDACIGGILFVISDTTLALNNWAIVVPYSHLIVMISYYSAQYFLALSTDF